jgi:sigma-B regulation protein RsbU (phosphoserine phosphatase)
VVLSNSGLPYPIRCSADGCAPVEIAGVPLGSFSGSTYDEVTFDLASGDCFIFCTDGVFEAMNGAGEEFGSARLLEVIGGARGLSSQVIVDRIFAAVERFRGSEPPNDDMTAVAVRITG